MKTDFDLKKLERTAWRLFNFKDGLWDIILGALIIYFGRTSLLVEDNVHYSYIIWASLLVVLLGKKFVTSRRLGQARFKKDRTIKVFISFLVIAVLIFAANALMGQFEIGTIVYPDLCGPNCNPGLPVYSNYGIALLAITVFVCFGIVAFSLNTWRLYFYGLLCATAAIMRVTADRPFGNISFSIAGFAVILIGLVLFLRFLKEYTPVSTVRRICNGDIDGQS